MLLLACGGFSASLRAENDAAESISPFKGEATCSSSGCHGGAGEKHDQSIRWSKLDIHTRSAATLTLARSARIADILQISNPTQSARCTICHEPFQIIATTPALVKALEPAAGVSCENCHGPAEKWLLTHTRTDLTHQDHVHAGLRDLNNLYVRANSCVACHQNVDADILAAGHPELIFELDGQSVSEPKHWRENEKWSGPQTWLVGQAVALREFSWQMTREKAPAKSAIQRASALLWLLQTAGKINGALPVDSSLSGQLTPENAAQAQAWSDQFARAAADTAWASDATLKGLITLAGTADSFRAISPTTPEQARRAERLVLALDRLTTGLNDTALAKRLDAPLNKLFKDSQSLPDFEAHQFADDLETFQKVLAMTP